MTDTTDTSGSLLACMGALPPSFDGARAERAIEDLRKCAEAGNQADNLSGDSLVDLLADDRAIALFKAVFGNSAYLTRTAMRFPNALPQVLSGTPSSELGRILADVYEAADDGDVTGVAAAFRRAKAEIALLTGFADVAGVWNLFDVTGALSDFADACLQSGLRRLLKDAISAGTYSAADDSRPEASSGIAIIAMGKYGARELNYSSDIDITVFFDEQRLPVSASVDKRDFCVRLTKGLVKLIQEMTADGYVFRMDLRLRPDAGATAVAVPMAAAEQYYESMGQNWERAAMIKARAAAGDIPAGEAFLDTLRPFIWRKYLDYAAIQDIHSIKRQIHRHGGHGKIGVAGHNVKLGLGGIREIEFFVQTQQLILGGRFPELRARTTVGGLEALAAHGCIEATVAIELEDSYRFLRNVEHRLQMREDAQTHVMPDNADEIDNVARFCGYEDTSDFDKDLIGHLERVNAHYQDLFAQEETLASDEGSLVFTGVDDDPETIETLTQLGFVRASHVAATVRGWHFGRIRASRTERGRALLTKLVPTLLDAIAETPDPDETFARFDDFMSGLPSGVQLFSLLCSRPELLELLTEALGTAPRLGPYLAKNAQVLDALLDPDFFSPLPTATELVEELENVLSQSPDFEAVLDDARRWMKDVTFRIGIQILKGVLHAEGAGRAYADVADTAIKCLVPFALAEVERSHGKMPGSGFAVIAMGKLGGRELAATSDLDLVIVYDHPEDLERSDGQRSIHGARYFTRVAQRLIAALSAPTAEGIMYEVDMQLRPSGKAGPIATQRAAFQKYYERDAWTWEVMALTRARLVCGTADLVSAIESTIKSVLCTPRDRDALAKDVTEMRERISREKGSPGPWQIKHTPGGLVDLEFICQYLQLAHGAQRTQVLDPNTAAALTKLTAAGFLRPEMGQRLSDAGALLHKISQIQRLTVSGKFEPDEAGESLRRLLAATTGHNDFLALEAALTAAEADIQTAFHELLVGGDSETV